MKSTVTLLSLFIAFSFSYAQQQQQYAVIKTYNQGYSPANCDNEYLATVAVVKVGCTNVNSGYWEYFECTSDAVIHRFTECDSSCENCLDSTAYYYDKCDCAGDCTTSVHATCESTYSFNSTTVVQAYYNSTTCEGTPNAYYADLVCASNVQFSTLDFCKNGLPYVYTYGEPDCYKKRVASEYNTTCFDNNIYGCGVQIP